MINDKIKEFIKENADLINSNQFEEFYQRKRRPNEEI